VGVCTVLYSNCLFVFLFLLITGCWYVCVVVCICRSEYRRRVWWCMDPSCIRYHDDFYL